jgi:transposase InsO family protein
MEAAAMPWKAVEIMSLRQAFVQAAQAEGANISALCRGYGISRETGYKWLRRYVAEGASGLVERSRRPHTNPTHTPLELEQRIVAARQAHPKWGGRKLKRWLENQGEAGVPTPSTITAILRRHGLLDEEESRKHRPFQRFERATPNELWQMDFKGDVVMGSGQRGYPLTVEDDCSRFLIGLNACADRTYPTVQHCLTAHFRAFGLPQQMLMDHGSPWGDDALSRDTVLTVWLLRLGVGVLHGRIRHPQTQGKVERLHGSLQRELLAAYTFQDLADCQTCLDQWRTLYNTERPHEALDLDPPAAHYQPSPRPFPGNLPELSFPPGAATRKTDEQGRIAWQGRTLRVGRPFQRQPVGILPDETRDGVIHVYFNAILIRSIDLTARLA